MGPLGFPFGQEGKHPEIFKANSALWRVPMLCPAPSTQTPFLFRSSVLPKESGQGPAGFGWGPWGGGPEPGSLFGSLSKTC